MRSINLAPQNPIDTAAVVPQKRRYVGRTAFNGTSLLVVKRTNYSIQLSYGYSYFCSFNFCVAGWNTSCQSHSHSCAVDAINFWWFAAPTCISHFAPPAADAHIKCSRHCYPLAPMSGSWHHASSPWSSLSQILSSSFSSLSIFSVE